MNRRYLWLPVFIILSFVNYCTSESEQQVEKNAQADKNNKNICETTAVESSKKIVSKKVVIHLFCGRGCVSCRQVMPVINKIVEKYGLELKKYEVWYNDKNRSILLNMAKERNADVKGVPVVIIRNDVYMGIKKINKLEKGIKKYL